MDLETKFNPGYITNTNNTWYKWYDILLVKAMTAIPENYVNQSMSNFPISGNGYTNNTISVLIRHMQTIKI